MDSVGATGQAAAQWRDRPELAPVNPTGSDLLRLVRRGIGLRHFDPPAFPGASARLLSLTNDEDVDLRTIASIIQEDMILSAQIIQLMQSPLYNRGVEITSIEQAVGRLGLAALRGVVAQAALSTSVFGAKTYQRAMEQLRRHSAVTAQLAQLVSRALGVRHDLAFLAGLFHDVGLAVPMLLFAEAYGDRPPPLADVWPELVRIHERLNWHVMLFWELPDGIRDIVRYHHTIPERVRDPVGSALVCVADRLATDCGVGHTIDELTDTLDPDGEGATTPVAFDRAGELLGLTANDYKALIEESERIIEQVD